MGRYIVCIVWGMIYTFIIGFIGAPLTQSTYNPVTLLIVGALFGLLFSLIIPKITAKSYKDDSAYSK
ncbi:YjzD family protein [Lactobacillus delbrueckii subsp. lactis]|uniref:YjzD family protein n=1 Tax=Lactobacillus delbrueckii TaxID=1584 RepID=UPI001E6542EE|nr:YjzD family protein [Lactobacillus delbrueckii]MCD5447848.1 YjzD family protein [Lactobacillus delbrueckii subsp. lactis]